MYLAKAGVLIVTMVKKCCFWWILGNLIYLFISNSAQPFIDDALTNLAPKDCHFVIVDVGDRTAWKDMKNSFRCNKNAQISVIPTLINWNEKDKRLEGGQLCKPSLLEMFFENEWMSRWAIRINICHLFRKHIIIIIFFQKRSFRALFGSETEIYRYIENALSKKPCFAFCVHTYCVS